MAAYPLECAVKEKGLGAMLAVEPFEGYVLIRSVWQGSSDGEGKYPRFQFREGDVDGTATAFWRLDEDGGAHCYLEGSGSYYPSPLKTG